MGIDYNIIGKENRTNLHKYRYIIIFISLLLVLISVLLFFFLSTYSFPTTIKIEKYDFIANEDYEVIGLHCNIGDSLSEGDAIITLSSENLSAKLAKLKEIDTTLSKLKQTEPIYDGKNDLVDIQDTIYSKISNNLKTQIRLAVDLNDSLQSLNRELSNTITSIYTDEEVLYTNNFSSKRSFFDERISYLEKQIELIEEANTLKKQELESHSELLTKEIAYLNDLLNSIQFTQDFLIKIHNLKIQKEEILSFLLSRFKNYSVEKNNTITVNASQNSIISYLPKERYITNQSLFLSYVTKSNYYAESYILPELSPVIVEGSEVYILFDSKNTALGNSLTKAKISSISKTPNEENRYSILINFDNASGTDNFVHGLTGTVFYYK